MTDIEKYNVKSQMVKASEIGAFLKQFNINANQGLKKGGRKTAQKSRECKHVANKSHKALLRCLRQ